MDTSLIFLNDVWNACLDEVLREIDARIRVSRRLRPTSALAELREDLLLLRRGPSTAANEMRFRKGRSAEQSTD